VSAADRNETRGGRAVSRRGFLKSALGAGGALVVGFELVPGLKWTELAAAQITGGGSLGVYVTIGADNTVTLTCPTAEMGQGVATALPMILAEELMVDWTAVKVILGGYDPGLARPVKDSVTGLWSVPSTSSQSAGGSNSVRSYHDYLREVGATARQKLIWAASARSGIAVADLQAVSGTVVQRSTGTLVDTYGNLAADAVAQTPNDVAWVQPPYRIIGTPIQRVDIPKKVNGSAVFGIDVRLDNMLYASVKLAPKIGQTVGTYGTVTGAIAVVPVPAGGTPVIGGGQPPLGGVAVVTDTTTWQAVKAARGLAVTWVDAAYTPNLDTALMKTRAEGLMTTGTAVTASPKVGDAAGTIAAAPTTQRYTATYSAPYLHHVTMEPMNATVLVTDTTCEIWAPTQVQTKAAQTAATLTGLPLSAIKVNTTFLGGGFGRRLQVDYIWQAVTVAMHPSVKGRPVKMVWSREEDFTHDFYRPASLTKFEGSVDSLGNITAVKARVVCPSSKYQGGTLTTGTVDSSAVDGLVNALYNFPNKTVEWVLDTVEVPVGSWRSVGNSQNCFFIESFLDEIAIGTKQDPIALRRKLLNSGSATHLRALAVLDALVTASNWNAAPPSGRARGMALSMSFGDTIVGEVAEVSGSVSAGFKVWNVTVVVDPGSVVNPDTVKAQVESAVHQGLAAMMRQGQRFVAGEPMYKNFNTYRMNRLKDTPAVNTVILQSGAKMGGIGEPALPPIAPAVANAIAKLTGTRIRALPVMPLPVPPTVTSFTPTSGGPGTSVVIAGTGFSSISSVTFGGVAATAFTVNSTTKITATVPAGAVNGPIAVNNAYGSGVSTASFTVTAAAPVITSFTPTSGAIGSTVTVTGSNFTGATAVTFGGIAATSFTVVSATQVTAVVPSGLLSGAIAITTPLGTGTSTALFSVSTTSSSTTTTSAVSTTTTVASTTTTAATGAPTISSFTPSSGKVGTSVTLGGTNFTGATSVTFGGVAATFTVSSSTKITTKVPTGAKTGPISVTTPKGTATTKNTFSVG